MKRALPVMMLAAACAGAPSDAGDETGETGETGGEGLPPSAEPPPNPTLADSAWPASHRGSYAQGSSPMAGPEDDDLGVDTLAVDSVSITLAMSSEYDDGSRLIWGSTLFSIYKLRVGDSGLEVVDQWMKPGFGSLVSGAYTLVDADGTFFATEDEEIRAYRDSVAGDWSSPIDANDAWPLPMPGGDEVFIALAATYDGWLAYATSTGRVGVVSRDFASSHEVQLGDGGEVSNSIAIDEDGGIYVVSSAAMHRVQWTGSTLSMNAADGAWTAGYETGPTEPFAGRLGTGSGSTPSLMGADDEDRFVVITDGLEHMNLVLMWRDAIPEDWDGLGAGIDRRIAAQVPIHFGDPDATRAISEQSVLVSGMRAVVVNNDYGEFDNPLQPIVEGIAPPGVEQFEWDPDARTLTSTWSRDDLSCPNGIPTMSRATGIMSCIGKRGDAWTLEGLDWMTGEEAFVRTLGPADQFNSSYAATEIMGEGAVLQGTTGAVVRIAPR